MANFPFYGLFYDMSTDLMICVFLYMTSAILSLNVLYSINVLMYFKL